MDDLSLVALFEQFPDEDAATRWLEEQRWPHGERFCPHCGCIGSVQNVPAARPMPYRCCECKKYFSLRTGSVMERSQIPLHKWLVAAFLMMRGKGVSSVQLGRDLGITQKSAWFMAHRLRYAMKSECGMFSGPVEVDEVYLGGKNKNRHWDKKLRNSRGAVGKTPVIGIKDRETGRVVAEPVENATQYAAEAMIESNVKRGADVFTDESVIYHWVRNRQSVNHSRGQYVRGDVHTNGIESIWALLKRGYMGVYHWWSAKHTHRYVDECAGRYNLRWMGTLDALGAVFAGMQGRRLTWKELVG